MPNPTALPPQFDTLSGAPERNPHLPNQPGWYKDPENGTTQEVIHAAAADALARMGWTPTEAPGAPLPTPEPQTGPAAAKTGGATYDPNIAKSNK